MSINVTGSSGMAGIIYIATAVDGRALRAHKMPGYNEGRRRLRNDHNDEVIETGEFFWAETVMELDETNHTMPKGRSIRRSFTKGAWW